MKNKVSSRLKVGGRNERKFERNCWYAAVGTEGSNALPTQYYKKLKTDKGET